MTINKVVLIGPRGFCAGVDRAIQVVEDCLEIFGKPVYVKHEIVHNKHVVKQLANKGAITIENPDEVPKNSIVIFSAHGSPPEHYEKAKKRNLKIIDATCPLVTKVHLEVHRFTKEGYRLVYIGHKKHIEGIGVRQELPGEIPLVESVEDVEQLDIGNPEKLIYLTQTTLSVDDTQKIIDALKKKYPQISDPPKEDICYATTNRQKAIKELAKKVECILVVGSVNSSNSQRLVETAKNQGVPSYLIDTLEEIQPKWFEGITSVGISAGASAPERLVQEITKHFVQQGAIVENLQALKENMWFMEPPEIISIKKEKGINLRTP